MYATGRGVAQDYAQVLEWFRKAAAQRLVYAQLNISVMYSKGLGVALSRVLTYMWLEIAASGGHDRAVKTRDKFASMLSPEELHIARRKALKCVASCYRVCG